MQIRPSDYGLEPAPLEGTIDPAILELDTKSVRIEAPIQVNLLVIPEEEGTGHIIHGTLNIPFKVECGRCLDWIDWPVEVPNFTVELPKPQPPVVDLTPFLREDILLNLPFNVACRLEAGDRCPFSGKSYPPAKDNPAPIAGKDAWQELDKLKIKE